MRPYLPDRVGVVAAHEVEGGRPRILRSKVDEFVPQTQHVNLRIVRLPGYRGTSLISICPHLETCRKSDTFQTGLALSQRTKSRGGASPYCRKFDPGPISTCKSLRV